MMAVRKKVVYAWELGGDLGHITRFLPVANRLQQCGCEITFVLRDISRSERVLGKFGHCILQAPIWLPPSRTAPAPPINYAEILQHYGYLSVSGLTGVLKAWRGLLELLEPDLLVFDYAPTAMLASRELPINKASIGTGFCLPPKQEPLPAFMDVPKPRRQVMARNERRVLATINKSLEILGIEPLPALHHLFDVDQQFLCTTPHLDHFEGRVGEEYWGVDTESPQTKEPEWRNNGNPKLFGYLKHQHPDKEAILQALSDIEADTIIYSPDISDEVIKRYSTENLRFTRNPLSYKAVMRDCNLVVFHAGHGTAAAALEFNTPSLCAPLHNEQSIIADNLAKLGNSQTVNIGDDADTIKRKVIKLLDSGREKSGSRKVTRGKTPELSDQPAGRIADRCIELIM